MGRTNKEAWLKIRWFRRHETINKYTNMIEEEKQNGFIRRFDKIPEVNLSNKKIDEIKYKWNDNKKRS